MTFQLIDLEALHDQLLAELLAGAGKKNSALLEDHNALIQKRGDVPIDGVSAGPVIEVVLPSRFVVGMMRYLDLAELISEETWAFAQRAGLKHFATSPADHSRGRNGRYSIFVGVRSW